jgi:hypothetical protein
MRGVIISLLLFVLVLFISGCQQPGQTNVGGVDMMYIEGQPRIECIDEVGYCLGDGEEFRVGVRLKNNLPKKVVDATLCIFHTVSSSTGGVPAAKPCRTGLEVPPAQESGGNMVAGIKDEIFGPYSYIGVGRGNDETNINAELQYPVFSTFKISDVCVKRRPSEETDFPCLSKQSFSGEGISGEIAPVVVDRVEKNLAEEGDKAKIRLNIHLRKALQGDVVWENTGENKLELEAVLGNNLAFFQCGNTEDGLVDFKAGTTKEIQCTAVVDMSEQSAFKEALNIYLTHDYYVLMPTGKIKLTEDEVI